MPLPPPPAPDKFPNVFVATLKQQLAQGGSETSIHLSTIQTLDGQPMQDSDFAWLTEGIISIDVQSATRVEFASFTGVDPITKTLTGVVRGLSFKDKTVIGANKKFHSTGAPVVISWGTQNIIDLETKINENYTTLVNYIDSIIISQGVPASMTNPGILMVANATDILDGNDTRPFDSVDYDLSVLPSQLKEATSNVAARSFLAAANISDLDAVYMKSYTPTGGILPDNKDVFNGSFIIPASSSGNYSFTRSYTVGSISNGMMLVSVLAARNNLSNSNVDGVVSATFDGVPMTVVDSVNNTYQFGGSFNETDFIKTFMLPSPSIGTHILEITVSGYAGGSPFTASVPTAVYTYANCAQVTTPDAHTVNSQFNYPNPQTPSNSLSTTVNDCLVWSWNIGQSGGSYAWATGNPNNQAGSSPGFHAGDSGIILSPAAHTVTTVSDGAGFGIMTGSISLAPFTSATFGIDRASAAAATAPETNFFGFAPVAGLKDTNVKVITTGYIDGFTSLSPALYYLQDSPGQIGTTPGTVTKKVGIGVSPTTLLLIND